MWFIDTRFFYDKMLLSVLSAMGIVRISDLKKIYAKN